MKANKKNAAGERKKKKLNSDKESRHEREKWKSFVRKMRWF